MSDTNTRIEELEALCAEAYIVVGALLSAAGMFDTEAGQNVLDNLAEAKLIHKNVIPFTVKQRNQND